MATPPTANDAIPASRRIARDSVVARRYRQADHPTNGSVLHGMDSLSPVLARPLDPRWIALVDGLAPRVLGRDDRTGAALVAEVIEVSELYTRERHAIARASEALASRLRFFLPRDLPKVQGPLAELARAGALPPNRVWRVLDLGAGLGSSTLGAAELAKRAGVERLEVTALDRSRASLDVFTQLAREAAGAGLVPRIALETYVADLDGLEVARLPEVDLVLMGLTLNELFADGIEADRMDARERLLRDLTERLAPGGAMIVVEPALRSETRALAQLRDRLAEGPEPPYVFAPCLRDGPCPLLRRERDWCHDVLPLALPKALAAIAQAAGLRQERLTYSYLTLRNDAHRLWDTVDRDPRAFRIVGGPVLTKGKTEWDACGAAGLVRLRRMERERSEANAALDGAMRGTLVRIEADVNDGSQLRIRAHTEVEAI